MRLAIGDNVESGSVSSWIERVVGKRGCHLSVVATCESRRWMSLSRLVGESEDENVGNVENGRSGWDSTPR